MSITASLVGVALLAQAVAAQPPSPLSLRAAMAEALTASPTLGASADDRTMAGIRERVAAAGLSTTIAPVLQTGTNAGGLSERSIGLDLSKRFSTGTRVVANVSGQEIGSGLAPYRDAGYTVGVSQPLLGGFGGVFKAPLVQARRDVVTSERALADARLDLIVNVAAAYLDVIQAQRLVGVASRSMDQARTLRASAAARVSVGLATELDVSRADWMASQAEATWLAERDAEADATDRLSRLLGRSSGAPLQLESADLTSPALMLAAFEPPPLSNDQAARSAELVSLAIANRPDLRESRDRIADAERAQRIARWDLLPQVSLDVSYLHRGVGNWSSPLMWAGANGWRVGLSTDYSFNRASANAGVAETSVAVRAAERAARDHEGRIADEVRRADRNWTRSAATIEIQTKAVALAERQLRLAQLRYERGIAGNFDVIDAESNLYQAQTALVSAQGAHALAGLTLRRVTGTLSPEEILR